MLTLVQMFDQSDQPILLEIEMHINAKIKKNASGGGMRLSTGTASSRVTLSYPQIASADPEASLSTFADGDERINDLLSQTSVAAIPDGIYIINNTLSVSAGDTLRPASLGGLVVLKAADGYTGRFINVAGANGFVVERLTFDGNWTTRSAHEGTDTAAIIYTSGNNFTVQSCTFRNCPSYAIWEYNCSASTITGNRFTECWQPLRKDCNLLSAGSFTNNVIVNTTAFKSIQGLDAFGGGSGFNCSNNNFQGCGTLEPTSHGFEGTWGNAIYLTNLSNSTVSGNTVTGCYWSSLVIGASCTNTTVNLNTLADGVASTAAIWCEQPGADIVTITNNTITGMISCGDGGGDHVVISANTITSRDWGINLNVDAKNCRIANNTLTNRTSKGDTTALGIFIWEHKTTSVSCQVTNNAFIDWNSAVYCNNDGGVGTIYNIDVTSSTYTNCVNNAVAPTGVTIDPSCSGIVNV